LQEGGIGVAPELEAVIGGAGGEKGLGGMKGGGADGGVVGAEAMLHGEGVGIEDHDKVVAAADGDEAAVGRGGEGVEGAVVIERGEDAARLRIEDGDGAFLRVVGLEFAGDGDEVAVRACEDGFVGVVFELVEHGTAAGVVDDEMAEGLGHCAQEACATFVKVEVHGAVGAQLGGT
jgi:hypothetical protein